MGLNELLTNIGPGDLLGLGALLISGYVAYNNHQMGTKVSAVDAFDKLCEALRKRLATVEAELERARSELERMHGENGTLRGRVRELEDERDRLLAQIAELVKKHARKGAKGKGA